MGTNISSPTSYASGADAIVSIDVRQWGDVLMDNDTRVAAGSVPGNATLAALLLEASGMVEMGCFRGNKYSVADLQALQGASLQLLKGLVTKLAYWLAFSRRFPERPLPPITVWALQTLEALNEGKTIFSLAEQADAGVQSSGQFTAEDLRKSGAPTCLAARFFGRRGWQQGGGGCGEDC